MERARSDLEESKKKSTEARKRKVDEIVENVRRQMHDLLGAENARNLRHREDLIRGQHYYAQLVSSGPVPGGQSIIIEVGTRSLDYSITNDMAIDSRSHYRWFINSVEVRIVP